MGTHIKIKPYIPTTPSEIVEFDTTDPNLGGTIFTPDIQGATNTLYISRDPSTIGQTWVWNTTSNTYETYTVDVPDSTPFWLYGTTIDAGSNKTAFIQRNGPIFINSAPSNGSRYAGYFYSRATSGQGSGVLIRKDSRTTSGNYLLIQGHDFSTNISVDKLKVDHNGKLSINDAYTLPNVGGTAGQVLTDDGAGNVTWQSGGSSGIFGIANASGVYTYYTTLTLAMTAAVSGDTIEIFADVEETGSVTITLKDGVKINGNGHTYILSVDDATNALTMSSVGTYDLYNWNVKRTGRTAGTTTGYTFYSTQTSAKINFLGVNLENTFGTCYYGGGQIKNAYGVGYLNGLYGGTGSYPVVHNSYFESTTSGTGMYVPYTNIYNSTGVSNSGIGISCNGNVFESMGISVSNTGIQAQRMNKCIGISTSGKGLHGGSRNCTGISTSGFGGASGDFYNSTLISSSNYGLSGANAYNCSVQSSTSIATSSCSIYNSTIRCLWNNVGGHCTITFALGLREIVNSILEVTNSSAYCISAYVGSTWKYANNSFKGATIPINPSLIQGITNTSDSQGNILI